MQRVDPDHQVLIAKRVLSEVKIHLKVGRKMLEINGVIVQGDIQYLDFYPAVALLILQGKVRPFTFRAGNELVDAGTGEGLTSQPQVSGLNSSLLAGLTSMG
ncbi:MAG: hypothetical protein U9R58_14660 [Chloroflexota bacterium]|nr:hypothetical protein [Chloroflexota bacterium]